MRSRTELVTTTFVDSEEEYSEDDDSEEDWRPSASSSNKNGKKQQKGGAGVGGDGKRGGRKRKAGVGGNAAAKAKRRAAANYRESDEDDVDDETEPSEDEFDDFEDYGAGAGGVDGTGAGDSAGTNVTTAAAAKKTHIYLPPKKQFTDKGNSSGSAIATGNDAATGTLDLLVYKRDILDDFSQNNRLCLWRKDDNNLLQKYIRVKTAPEEFLFTSSSVYSSWDEQRITDFVSLKVNSLDTNNRRVRVPSISILQKLAAELAETKLNEKHVDDGNEDADDLDEENEDEEDEPNTDDTDAEDSADGDVVDKTINNQKTTIKKKANVKFSEQDLNDLDNESELDEDEPEDEEEDDDEDEVGADEESAEECQQPSAVK